MTKRKQVFLTPGDYDLGKQRTRAFTAEELTEIVSNTLQLKEQGFLIPVFDGHPEIGSPEGGPHFSTNSIEPNEAIIGEMVDLWQNEDGSLEYVIELFQEDADDQLTLPEFTSPEIRNSFSSEEIESPGPIIAHVALTSNPRNEDQEPMMEMEEALQFSLANKVKEGELETPSKVKDSLISLIQQTRNIPKALQNRLVEQAATIQLAADGSEEPSLTISETVSLLEETLPDHLSLTDKQLVTVAHPSGEQFYQGSDSELSDNQAEQYARQQLLRTGFLKD